MEPKTSEPVEPKASEQVESKSESFKPQNKEPVEPTISEPVEGKSKVENDRKKAPTPGIIQSSDRTEEEKGTNKQVEESTSFPDPSQQTAPVLSAEDIFNSVEDES